MSDATVMLAAVQRGEPNAADQLIVLGCEELRKLARETTGQTPQPTEVIHAWLRLVNAKKPGFDNRAHSFCAAGEARRRILITAKAYWTFARNWILHTIEHT